MVDLKLFKQMTTEIVQQINHCICCSKELDPINGSYTFMYQKIPNQPTALGVICNDCCMLRLAKLKETNNEA